jgi:hypothetical protein
MKTGGFLLAITLLSTTAATQTLQCSFKGYQSIEGMHAAMNRGILELTWHG